MFSSEVLRFRWRTTPIRIPSSKANSMLFKSLNSPKPLWKVIAQKCLRSALAASLPVYVSLGAADTAIAQGPFQVSVEELFEEPVALGTDFLSANHHSESLVRFRGGSTYLNNNIESHVGGTYGLDGVVPISEEFGIHWAGRANQFSGGTQFLTSLGAYKRSDSSGDLSEAIGASVVADLFTDSRVSDLWLAQLRGQVGVATSEDSAVGAAFTLPLNDNHSNQFWVPGNPIGPYSAVESAGLYATQYLDDYLAQVNIGYRKAPNSLYVDLSVRKPIVENKVFGYANTNYVEETGRWGAWVGVEVRLGGDGNASGGTRRREVWDDPAIFNTFNYGENSFWHNTTEHRTQGQGGPPPEEEGRGEEGQMEGFPEEGFPEEGFPEEGFPEEGFPN